MLCITSSLASLRSYVAIPAGWLPLSTSGCILWLDGNDSLYSDVGMTTLCTNTANVLAWKDKSASANHATNASSAFTCLTNHASFNGKSVFYYPSVTSNTNLGLLFTQPTTLPYSNSTCTIFIVFLTNNASNSSMMLSIGHGSGHRQIYTTGGVAYMDKNGGAMVNSGASSITLNQPYITTFTSGSTQNGYKNGNIFSITGSSSQFTNGTPTTGRVGSNINSILTDGIRGAIAEIIIYDTILSTNDRYIVENYLMSKYLIGITGGRYDNILAYYNYSLGSSMVSGTTVRNSAYPLTATYDGTTNLSSFEASNQGAYFYIGIYQNLPFTLGATPAFSIVFNYARGDNSNYGRLFSLINTTKNSNFHYYFLSSALHYSGRTGTLLSTGGTNTTSQLPTNLALSSSTQIVFTYQSNVYTLHVSNASSASVTSTSFQWATSDAITLKIGARAENDFNFSTINSTNVNTANTYMKSVRVYPYKLSATEITDIYAGVYPFGV